MRPRRRWRSCSSPRTCSTAWRRCPTAHRAARMALLVGTVGLALSGAPDLALALGAGCAVFAGRRQRAAPMPTARRRARLHAARCRHDRRRHAAGRCVGLAGWTCCSGASHCPAASRDHVGGRHAQPGQAAAVVHLAGLAAGALDAVALAPAAARRATWRCRCCSRWCRWRRPGPPISPSARCCWPCRPWRRWRPSRCRPSGAAWRR